MSRFEDQAFSPSAWHPAGNGVANTELVVTRASDGADHRHYITSLDFSFNGAPAADVVVVLASGAAVIKRFRVPAAAMAPVVINFTHPLVMDPGQATTLTVPAAGAGIIASAGFDGYHLRD